MKEWDAVEFYNKGRRDFLGDAGSLVPDVAKESAAADVLRALAAEAERRGMLKAAGICRASYPKESDYDPRFKIAAHSIAGTLERIANSPAAISAEGK